MIAAGDLELVDADRERAEAAIEEARKHVESARLIARSDPNGAYQLAYDEARKAVMSAMRSQGIRARKAEGAHAITAACAGVAIDVELGKQLDAARRRRNRALIAAVRS